MDISIDTETSFDKMPKPTPYRNSQSTRIEINFLSLTKDIY